MSHYKKMLVEDFIKIQDNPIQRDTEKHALKAKHLRTVHPTHSFVYVAELPNGKLIKLDGHTRALLWKRKEIPVPIQVNVAVIPAKDMEEVEQYYKDFDSKDAVETQTDKVYGAFNRHNFEPQSDLVRSGQLTYALRIAYGVFKGMSPTTGGSGSSKTAGTKTDLVRTVDIYSMIDEFSYELHALDAFGLQRSAISSGAIAAFVISYRRYGHKITPFWTGVFANDGMKQGGKMDAIQALTELLLARKGKFGGKNAADVCSRSLRAIEHWLKDEMLYRIPTPLDTTGYLVGYEQPTERLIERKDLEKAKINRERATA